MVRRSFGVLGLCLEAVPGLPTTALQSLSIDNRTVRTNVQPVIRGHGLLRLSVAAGADGLHLHRDGYEHLLDEVLFSIHSAPCRLAS